MLQLTLVRQHLPSTRLKQLLVIAVFLCSFCQEGGVCVRKKEVGRRLFRQEEIESIHCLEHHISQ